MWLLGVTEMKSMGIFLKLSLAVSPPQKSCLVLFLFCYCSSLGIIKFGLETMCYVCFEVLYALATLLLKKDPVLPFV